MESEVMQLFDSLIDDADMYMESHGLECWMARIEFARLILDCKRYTQAIGKREAHQKFALMMNEVDKMYKKLCEKENLVDAKARQLEEKMSALSKELDRFASFFPIGDADDRKGETSRSAS